MLDLYALQFLGGNKDYYYYCLPNILIDSRCNLQFKRCSNHSNSICCVSSAVSKFLLKKIMVSDMKSISR